METLTRKQAADRLKISLRTFERRRRNGVIPPPIKTIKMYPLLWDAKHIEALKAE